jgi:hypothetical protein
MIFTNIFGLYYIVKMMGSIVSSVDLAIHEKIHLKKLNILKNQLVFTAQFSEKMPQDVKS